MLSFVMWPEARAGSPSAAAPRGRRLQRRGRRRIMRPRSWPGRVDPDPLGSARLRPGRCSGGNSPAEAGAQRRDLDSGAERPRNWTRARSRRSSYVLPVATPEVSERRFVGTLAISSGTELPKA